MADENGAKPPLPPAHEPELLPAIMAIALAVVAQLALQDGLTLLALPGYVVAVWLFVVSVRDILDRGPAQPAAKAGRPEPVTGGAPAPSQAAGADRLAYLRHNWRLVTLAEIFRGDIPPARLGGQELGAAPQVEPDQKAESATAQEAPTEETPAARAAGLEQRVTAESPAASTIAVKVTPQGDVLVLDSGLAQVQRFDAGGNLLATYSTPALAGLEIADLAVSPDGATVYVVDATSKHLQVIALTDEEKDQEEE